jgi:hypothetical protein
VKYYVIPIDSHNNALMGIKANRNPYNKKKWWGGGGPNPFGGNDDGHTPFDTIAKEAQQESHRKIDIDTAAKLVEVHKSTSWGDATYYAIRGGFTYNPAATLSTADAAKKSFKETTGGILIVNLKTLDVTSAATAAAGVLTAQKFQGFGGSLTLSAEADFAASDTAEALRKAAEMVQTGAL